MTNYHFIWVQCSVSTGNNITLQVHNIDHTNNNTIAHNSSVQKNLYTMQSLKNAVITALGGLWAPITDFKSHHIKSYKNAWVLLFKFLLSISENDIED